MTKVRGSKAIKEAVSKALELREEVHQDQLRKAVLMYLRRILTVSFPLGDWVSDVIWKPTSDERESCCEGIRVSKKNRLALYNHCKGLEHIGVKFGIGEDELADMVGDKNLPLWMGLDADIDEYIARRLKHYSSS